MVRNDINDAEIREYLLGFASHDTVENLDELSFSDEFSERIGAAEFELIDEYLNESLSRWEKAAFEEHYLASPLRRGKVDFARALASHAERTGLIDALTEPEPKGSILDFFRNWRLTLQFAAAAAGLLLVAVFGVLIYRSGQTVGDSGPSLAQSIQTPTVANTTGPTGLQSPSVNETPTAPIGAENNRPSANQTASASPSTRPPKAVQPQQLPRPALFVLTPALRGSEFQTVKASKTRTPTEFRLVLETESDSPFSAEVIEMRGQARVWSARGLIAKGGASSRTLSLRVPADTLRTGEYGISIYSSQKNGEREKVGDYFVRVAP